LGDRVGANSRSVDVELLGTETVCPGALAAVDKRG
jgi:hypothetical protein